MKVVQKAGDIKFYSAPELFKRLGVSKEKFHKIKETILNDLKKECRILGAENPDIGG